VIPELDPLRVTDAVGEPALGAVGHPDIPAHVPLNGLLLVFAVEDCATSVALEIPAMTFIPAWMLFPSI